VTDLDERMAQLRARFRTRAAADRARIAAALDQADWDEVRRLAHGLSGSGGVFGFPQVSKDAEAVEIAIDEGRDAAQVRALGGRLLDRLAEVAQRD
jgi:HPt (histidine-containing phosphotransfer) domain-containing protein